MLVCSGVRDMFMRPEPPKAKFTLIKYLLN